MTTVSYKYDLEPVKERSFDDEKEARGFAAKIRSKGYDAIVIPAPTPPE